MKQPNKKENDLNVLNKEEILFFLETFSHISMRQISIEANFSHNVLFLILKKNLKLPKASQETILEVLKKHGYSPKNKKI